MWIAFVVLFIVICVIVTKKSKQKKIEKKKRLFNDVILKTVESYSEKRKVFEDIYDVYMEDVISDEKNALFKNIEEIEERYKKSLGELVSIAENNSVFFTTREEWKDIDVLEWNEKASKDIIKSIPYLINFIEAYQELVLGLYNYVYKIVTKYDYIWGRINYSADEDDSEYIRETMKKCRQSCCQTAMHCYRTFVEADAWDVIKKQYPQWSSKVDHDTFIGMAENNTEAINQWFEIWYAQFKAIDEEYKYGSAFSYLHHFINDTNEEFGNPAWMDSPTYEFKLGFDSAMPLLNAEKVNREELTEIRNQYIEGKLKGKYRPSFDPDEDEDDED